MFGYKGSYSTSPLAIVMQAFSLKNETGREEKGYESCINYIYLPEDLDSSLIQSVLETLLSSVSSIFTVLM